MRDKKPPQKDWFLDKRTCERIGGQKDYRFICKHVHGNDLFWKHPSNSSTHTSRYWRNGKNVSRSPLAEWPLSRCLCVCSVIRARSSAFQPAAPRGDCCLPLTLLLTGLCKGPPGAAGAALGGMIHKVWHLFGSKEVNCTRDRADCICRELLMCSARRQKGWGVKIEVWFPVSNSYGQNIIQNKALFFPSGWGYCFVLIILPVQWCLFVELTCFETMGD